MNLNTNGYTKHNNIEILKVEKDYAEGQVILREESMNPLGYTHGGLYFSLADSVAGAASWSNGAVYVTLNATIDYMIAVQSGTLHAKAHAISRSGKICVVNVSIYDDKEQLVNQGTFTMYLVKEAE